MKRIGILFGQERSFPAGARRADQPRGQGRRRRARPGRRRRPREPEALRPDPRPDQPGHPVLPGDPEEGRGRRDDRRQQPLLVDGRRQVLQQRARPTRRRRRARRPCILPSNQHPPDTTVGVDVEPRLPARVGRDVLSTSASRPSSSRTPAADGRASTASTNPDEFFAAYQRVRPERHDAPGRDRLRRVLPLLRDRPQVRPHHAVRPAAAPPRALRQERPADRAGDVRAGPRATA